MKIGIENLTSGPIAEQLANGGCLVDTNVIFAASFPLDHFNEWAEKVFNRLNGMGVPAYTNLNVRTEFIELNRQVLMPEGLIEFFNDTQRALTDEAHLKLRSLKSNADRSHREGRTCKLGDREIKNYRALLERTPVPGFENAWSGFCRQYFQPYIANAWDEAIRDLGINFIGTRAIESGKYFTARPNWKDAMNIIGQFGIGSADAMIVNLFLKSKFPLLVTVDKHMSDAVETLSNGTKLILTSS